MADETQSSEQIEPTVQIESSIPSVTSDQAIVPIAERAKAFSCVSSIDDSAGSITHIPGMGGDRSDLIVRAKDK
jgi:hypothetical protein